VQGESPSGSSSLKDGKRIKKGGAMLKLSNIFEILADASNTWGYRISERKRKPPGLTRSVRPSLQLPRGKNKKNGKAIYTL